MPGPVPKDPERRQRRAGSNVVALEVLSRDDIPDPRPEWDGFTVDAWDRVWQSPQAAGWSDEQTHVAYLWADALDRYRDLQSIVDGEPLLPDRFGALRENPAHRMAKDAFKTMLDLADRLAIPFKSKVSLGLQAAVVEERSLKSQAEKSRKAVQDPRR